MPNYYEILKVPEDASVVKIDNAVQNLINDWDPSFVKDSKNRDVMSDVQKDIIHMRDTLTSPDKRREYDASLRESRVKMVEEESDESVYEDALEYITDDESDWLQNSFGQQYSDTFVSTSVLDLQRNREDERHPGTASLKVELQPATEEDYEPKYYRTNPVMDVTQSDASASLPMHGSPNQDLDNSTSDSTSKYFDSPTSKPIHKNLDLSEGRDYLYSPTSESVYKDFDSSLSESPSKYFDSSIFESTRRDFDTALGTQESTSDKSVDTKLIGSKQPSDDVLSVAHTVDPKEIRAQKNLIGDEMCSEMQSSHHPETTTRVMEDSMQEAEPMKARTVCSYFDGNNEVDLCVEIVKKEHDKSDPSLNVTATIDINGTKITTTHNSHPKKS